MRFKIGPQKPYINYHRWYKVFAWLPVRVKNQLIWLEFVEKNCSQASIPIKKNKWLKKAIYRFILDDTAYVEKHEIGRLLRDNPLKVKSPYGSTDQYYLKISEYIILNISNTSFYVDECYEGQMSAMVENKGKYEEVF